MHRFYVMFYPPWNYYAFECKYLTRSRQKLEISEYLKISAFVSTWHHENTICIVLQRLKNLGVVLPLESDELLGWSVWLRTTSHAHRRSVIILVSVGVSDNKCISISIKNNQILLLVSVWNAQYIILQSAKSCNVYYLSCISYNLGLSYLYNYEGLVASDAGERRTTVFNLQIRGGE